VDNFAETRILLDPFEASPLILGMTRKDSKSRPRRVDKSAEALRENLMKRKAQARARAEQSTTEKK
jgi:hypothetical protein